MLEPYHSTTSANFIITILAQLHVRTARRLATKQETVGLFPRRHAMDVEKEDTSGSTVQTWRIKMELVKLVRTLTLLRVRSSTKIFIFLFKLMQVPIGVSYPLLLVKETMPPNFLSHLTLY
ncbi:hypothetical protein Tco_0388621 [Tanacetum coccineum]